MKGPKYIETNLQTLMARKLEYYKHIQTLKNIKCDPTIGLKSVNKQMTFLQTLNTNRQAALSKRQQEKHQDIFRQNTKILIKMANLKEDANISRCKFFIQIYNPQKALSRSRIESAKSVKSIKSIKSVQSLKAVKVRQQEIKLENKRLKQKIEKAQPAFPFIKSQKEFKKHLDDKSRIIRNSKKNQQKLGQYLDQFINIQKTHSMSVRNKQTNDKLPILRYISQNSVRGAGELNKLRIGFSTERQFKH